MTKELNKTDRFLNLVLAINSSSDGHIHDDELREILGNPSKSQYHKYVIELTKPKPGRPAVMNREKVPGSFRYSLADNIKIKGSSKPRLTLIKNPQMAELKIWGDSIETFNQLGIPHDLMTKDGDYHHYKCQFQDEEEFLSMVFPFADDVEIISPSHLKDRFIQKAEKALFMNMADGYVAKKAA